MPVQCATSVQLVAVRASRLATDGAKICPNPDGSAYSMRPIQLQIEPQTTTGDRIEQKDGSGNICVVQENPDLTTGMNLTLQLCQLDPELLEVLTAGQIIVSGPNNFGYIGPSGEESPDPVEFHAWSKAWTGSSQAGDPYSFIHWVFPLVQWTLGGQTLGNSGLVLTLTGKARPNPNLNLGSFGDLPSPNIGDSYIGWYFTDAADVPDPTVAPYDDNDSQCGYIDTPSCGS
jgi:hypothetical protein